MDNELIETIKKEASQYSQAVGKVGKLHLVGIISRVLGLFLLIFTVVLCALALFAFFAVALIDILDNYMPVWGAALVVSSLYIVLIIVAVACRKPLFVHPFIALLTKQAVRTQRELDLETLKASQEVELQNVRIATKVDNATREISFYALIIRRVWKWLTERIRKS
jgi:hypothetical protein